MLRAQKPHYSNASMPRYAVQQRYVLAVCLVARISRVPSNAMANFRTYRAVLLAHGAQDSEFDFRGKGKTKDG